VDRWLHSGVPVYLPADVDLQAGVRRVGSLDRSPQVFLNTLPVPLFAVHLYILVPYNTLAEVSIHSSASAAEPLMVHTTMPQNREHDSLMDTFDTYRTVLSV